MHDTINLVIVGVLSALGGGGIWVFATRWLDRNKETEQAEIVRLREDIAASKLAHSSCEVRVSELEKRVETVEHHHASQLPRWIMRADKRVSWINDVALLTIFARMGLSRVAVIGHTFAEILDPQAATEFDRLERAALAEPGLAASAMVTMAPGMPALHVVVVTCIGRESELIYEGYAFRTQDPAVLLARGQERQTEQRGASALRSGATATD